VYIYEVKVYILQILQSLHSMSNTLDSSEPYNSSEPYTSAIHPISATPALSCRDREAMCSVNQHLRSMGMCETASHLEQCKQEKEIKIQILSKNFTEMLVGLKLATPNIGIEWDKQRHTALDAYQTSKGVRHTLLTFCLTHAPIDKRIQMVDELLRLGASPSQTASNGLSPMTAAIIGFGSRDDDADYRDYQYRRSIHGEVDLPSYEPGEVNVDEDDLMEHAHKGLHYDLKTVGLKVLNQLLKAGADVDNENATLMETPLIAAARMNSIPCAKFLLSAGADPDRHYSRRYPVPKNDIERYFGDWALFWKPAQFTAMRRAIINADPRMVRILLDAGANANKATEEFLTPLHFAALSLQLEAHLPYPALPPFNQQKSIVSELTIINLLIKFKATITPSRPVLFNSSSHRITASDILTEKGDIHLANFLSILLLGIV